MVAPYIHDEMPPIIRRTAVDHYQLEGQSGVVVAEFDRSEMEHPGGWWSELFDAMKANYATTEDALHDVTLLGQYGQTELDGNGWSYIDDR